MALRRTTAPLWSETKAAPTTVATPAPPTGAVAPERGVFSGYAAVFGNEDGNGDIIERGAFTKTLHDAEAARRAKGVPSLWPVMWQHNTDRPIGGVVAATEDERGLWVTVKVNLDVPLGAEAFSGVKSGYLPELSIGYDGIRSHRDARGVRHLDVIRLWEVSLVSQGFAANQHAVVDRSSIKMMRERPPSPSPAPAAQVQAAEAARRRLAAAEATMLDVFERALTAAEAQVEGERQATHALTRTRLALPTTEAFTTKAVTAAALARQRFRLEALAQEREIAAQVRELRLLRADVAVTRLLAKLERAVGS